jgi:hypothetical protein
MSYREEKGQVILTVSRKDYDNLLFYLGLATASLLARHDELRDMLAFVNRLNDGNPAWTPYEIPERS